MVMSFVTLLQDTFGPVVLAEIGLSKTLLQQLDDKLDERVSSLNCH